MLKDLRLKLNNRLVAWAGVIGLGLLPCPDCGAPLALHIWPVAVVVWAYRRVRQRSAAQLDLLLTADLRERADRAADQTAGGDSSAPQTDL